ncbi:MAG TPA: EscF/YscF/HrpA family type III secretion system needle major subunit [Caulifigura sp.]|jgi:hypothetical protein|nr:EscF/YscF/HrpA family type III secretion system needle major subunit [Caulifigura sp.]
MSAPAGVGSPNAPVNAQAVGGELNIDTMNLEDLMFLVMSKRSEQLDDSVRGYAKQIEGRNGLMKDTNNMLAQARNMSANLKSGDKETMPAEMVKFFKDNGIELPEQVTTNDVSKGTLDEQIAAGEEIVNWLENDKPYTDNACIKGDLSPEMINKARSMGIEPSGDNPGQDWKSSDFDAFKSEVKTKLDALKTQKAAQPAAGDSVPADAVTSETYTKEEWDSIINSIQGFQEGLNNDSQLDMIKFQSLMSKYTTSVEMLSNVMKKLSDNASAIVRNI